MKTIPLTKGQVALVDDSDYNFLSQWKWYASKNGNTYYAQRRKTVNGKKLTIKMHRVIMNVSIGVETDHIDRNGLNNQRYNLRTCTRSQNNANRVMKVSNTGYIGVGWNNKNKKFYAGLEYQGKRVYLGSFVLAEDAAKAYNEAVLARRGEFARLNIL